MDERYYRADAASDRSSGSRMSRLFSRESRPAPTRQMQSDIPPQQYMSGFGGSSGVVINSPTTYEDVQLLIDLWLIHIRR
ncbi:MAG: hypothetical protein K2N18_04920, partial [Clostridia bacterium]|nr:hypothetical protein [Clostridia bacterium]